MFSLADRTLIYTDDCLDPGFGYENKDGYVRVWNLPKGQGGRLVMRHRWFWELHNGKIPKEFEINHLCKNRRCCNVEHLECIHGDHHAVISNEERYEAEFQEFKNAYLGTDMLLGMTQKQMGDVFNRSQSGICHWIQRVKEEETN